MSKHVPAFRKLKQTSSGIDFGRRRLHCSRCSASFLLFPIKVIWKDFVECSYCGLMWIMIDPKDLLVYAKSMK